MSELDFLPVSGPVRFESVDIMRRFVKQLLEYYQKQVDQYGYEVARLIRSSGNDRAVDEAIAAPGGIWRKIGPLLVDITEPSLGRIETMIETIDEFKFKATKTTEILRSLQDIDDLGIPMTATLFLYLRNGVPEKLVVDTRETGHESDSPRA